MRYMGKQDTEIPAVISRRSALTGYMVQHRHFIENKQKRSASCKALEALQEALIVAFHLEVLVQMQP